MGTDVRDPAQNPKTPEPSARRGWNHFPHQADIGLHGWGQTLAAAFEETALALTGAMVDPGCVAATQTARLRCRAPNLDLLLVDWLNALIFEMATRRMLFASFDVQLSDGELHATVTGERVDVERHRPAVEVKGATYTALSVACKDDGLWHARCVIDV